MNTAEVHKPEQMVKQNHGCKIKGNIKQFLFISLLHALNLGSKSPFFAVLSLPLKKPIYEANSNG
jgi:hypothetical protein